MVFKCLRLHNLKFNDNKVKKEDFIRGQFGIEEKSYAVYRITITLLSWAGFILDIVTYESPLQYWFYLSHWNEAFVNLYLLMSGYCVLRNFYYKKRLKQRTLSIISDVSTNGNNDTTNDYSSKNNQNPTATNSNQDEVVSLLLKNNSTVQLSPKHQQILDKDRRKSKEKHRLESNNLNFLEKATWCMYEFSFVSSLTVSLTYWAFLDNIIEDIPINVQELLHAVYGHVSMMAIMLCEAIISRHPAAFLHFIYVYLSGVVYILFTYILYVIRLNLKSSRSVIPEYMYWFTNWGKNSRPGILLCFGMGPVCMVLQGFLLLLHKLREYLSYKWNKDSDSGDDEDDIDFNVLNIV